MQADPLNFLDRKDSRFKKHHGTCDVVFRKLQQDGIGATKKSVQVRILRHRLAYKGLCFLCGKSLLLAWRRRTKKREAVPVHPLQ